MDAQPQIVYDHYHTLPESASPVLRYITLFDSVILFFIFVIALIKTRRDNRCAIDMHNVLVTTQKTDKHINNILFKLRLATQADRCVLGLFHNTNLYGYNYHLLKLSVFHESLKEGTESVKQKVKDIPLSYLSEEFALYEENDNKFIRSTDDKGLRQGCREHLNNIGIETVVNYLLVSDQVPFGILSLQFKKLQSVTFETIDADLERMYKHDMKYFHEELAKCIMKYG